PAARSRARGGAFPDVGRWHIACTPRPASCGRVAAAVVAPTDAREENAMKLEREARGRAARGITRKTAGWLAAATVVAAAAGCAAVKDYSVREAEESCADVQVCTVYGRDGERQSPCAPVVDGGGMMYPGDPSWPYTSKGVCDVVVDGKVTSSRL